jgi:hypothetical protein
MNDYIDFKNRGADQALHREPGASTALRIQARDGKLFAQTRDNDASVIADLSKSASDLAETVRYIPTIDTQGSINAKTTIKIVAQTPSGKPVRRSAHRLRVRVHDAGTVTLAESATMAVANATTLLTNLDSNKDILIEEAAVARLTTALTGANNDLVYTSVLAGASGNATTVAYVNPGTASAALSVAVTGQAITVNLATNAGTAQVETATVVAAAGATENGTLHVTVTSAAISGSPVIVPVSLTTADDTAAKVATAIRAALTANTATAAAFTVGGSTAAVTLTAKIAAANDSTLNIVWTDAVAGVAEVTASTNTTAGAAPAITSTAAQVETAIEASTAASALVTVANASGNDGTGIVTALAPTNLAGGNASGDVFWLELTKGSAGTVTIETGPAPFGEITLGDFSTKLNVTHA